MDRSQDCNKLLEQHRLHSTRYFLSQVNIFHCRSAGEAAGLDGELQQLQEEVARLTADRDTLQAALESLQNGANSQVGANKQ